MLRVCSVIGISIFLSACSALKTKDGPDYTRSSAAYEKVDLIKKQVQETRRYDETVFAEALNAFEADKDLLGQGDLFWIKGMSHFLVMKADNSDTFNYEQAQQSFERAKKHYLKMDEEWLAAKATLGMAFTNMRASRHWDACQNYDETIELLDSGEGYYKEFDYDTAVFSKPQEYVEGVFGEECAILRADPGRHNFDEFGNVKILKRSPAKEPKS